MKHHRFNATRATEGEEVVLYGELWTTGDSASIICIDFPDTQSNSFFRSELSAIIESLQAQFEVGSNADVYLQSGVGIYDLQSSPASTVRTYQEVAQDGYRLIGLEEDFFDIEPRNDRIMICESTFPTTDENQPLEAETHVWKGKDQRGAVLFNFAPDPKWVGLLKDEPLYAEVAAHFGLRRGVVILLPYADDPESGRVFVTLEAYCDDEVPEQQYSYADVKNNALGLLDESMSLESSKSLEIHSPRVDPGPGF